MDKEAYRCFLYKQEDGKTVSHIFTGQTAVDKALTEGWHTTFADFIDDKKELDDNAKAVAKDICSMAAGDANILANADQIEDIEMLKQSYERMSGKKMHHKVNTLEGARKAVKKALGETNGNSSDVH